MTAGLYGASRIIAIDLDDNRVEQAKSFGAPDSVYSGSPGLERPVLSMTDGGLGCDWSRATGFSALGTPLGPAQRGLDPLARPVKESGAHRGEVFTPLPQDE